jgi:hypothetical protein
MSLKPFKLGPGRRRDILGVIKYFVANSTSCSSTLPLVAAMGAGALTGAAGVSFTCFSFLIEVFWAFFSATGAGADSTAGAGASTTGAAAAVVAVAFCSPTVSFSSR